MTILLGAGDELREPLLEPVLHGLDQGEAEAPAHLGDDGLVDLLLLVAEDDGTVAAEHVDVVVAVDVDDMAAVAAVEEDRVLALDEVVGPPDAHDAAGREPLRVGEHGHGLFEPELGEFGSAHPVFLCRLTRP
ncbi:MAG: hypothetical protein M0Z80_13620 [Treponema sp.]|nr:hypothetical protein [Treponema sp.]